MKILAVSDMHGNVRNVLAAVEIVKPDILLSCGDWGEKGSVDEELFHSLLKRVTTHTVYGNHDDVTMLRGAMNSNGLPVLLESGCVYDLGSFTVGAINGIWAKSHDKPFYVTDDEALRYAGIIAESRPDVLISHACAIGLADEVPGGRHAGQKSWLEAFKAVSPRLYLCGHLHVAQKRILKNGRVIVNVGTTAEGDFWAFDIDQESLSYEQHRLPSVEQPDGDQGDD